jgi:hypothetical protein
MDLPNGDDDNGEEDRFEALDIKGSSIRKVHACSIRHWNMFASIQKYPAFHDLLRADVTGVILDNGSLSNANDPPIRKKMAEFANYLFNAKKTDGKNLMTKVQLQYLSGVKTVLFTEHKALTYTNTCDWYEELYSGLRIRASVASIARGESVSKKTVGFSRQTLANCCRFLMHQESEALGYEERCVILVLYHAVGRGGEVSTSTWNSAQWEDGREFLSFDWGELKKGQQYTMTFHPDAKGWELDVYHAIACYLIGGHGKAKASTSTSATKGVNWILPGYVDMKDGGASTKVSHILEKCHKGGVEGVHEGATSHGLRVTATDDMVFNHLLAVFAAIARGGWDFRGDNMAFYYFTAKLHVVKSGKVLAGWQDPDMHVSAPTVDAFKQSMNQDKVDAFCSSLFAGRGVPELNGRLRGFRDAMISSLLMYYDDLKKELTSNSKLILAMHRAAHEHGIELQTLSEWGTAVRNRFQAANAANLGDIDASEAKRQKKQIEILSKIVSDQQNTIKDMSGKFDMLLQNQVYQTGLLEDIKLGLMMTNASPQKRFSPQGTKRKIDPTTAAAAVPTSKQNIFAHMNASSRVSTNIDFSGCNEWSPTMLVMECLKQRQDVDTISRQLPWLGKNLAPGRASSTVNSTRLRCRKVYTVLREKAPLDKKKYFKPALYPSESLEQKKWEKEVEGFVPGLTDDLITELLRRLCQLRNKEYTENEKREFGGHIGAIAGLFEKVTEAETKKEASGAEAMT